MREGSVPGERGSRLTRAGFVAAAAGAAAAVVVDPDRARALTPRAPAAVAPTRTYHTTPITPPTVAVSTRTAGRARGYLFLAPMNGPGQHGPMIVDDRGRLVWFHPLKDELATAFRMQRYRGRPVLTWWQGVIVGVGTGQGRFVVVDRTYRQIAQVDAANGLRADLHELTLTSRGTALLCAYDEIVADVSAVGGAKRGRLLDSVVQEVDVRTGKLLFEWRSSDHVPVRDTYAAPTGQLPFDYFHVNSVDVDRDGNLVVSARNTCAVYKLDRRTGAVLWRLGGKHSDFALGAGARFMWQHDARMHADGTMTLFDDGPRSTSDPESRAIRLRLDETTRRADLVAQYRHPQPYEAIAMGSAQVLGDGGMLVGWGTVPGFTEFGPDGRVRLDATFVGGAWNYRSFRLPWRGRPATRPAVAAVTAGGRTTVYASWNGSTETAFWEVRGGERRGALRRLATVEWAGFETAVTLRERPRYVAVVALDASRRGLARSRQVAV